MKAARVWSKQKDDSDNLPTAMQNLLRQMDISVPRRSVQDALRGHPEFPSLLSARDSLASFGMESEAFRVAQEQLDQIPLPCLAHLHEDGGRFVIVNELASDQVTLLDPASGWSTVPRTDFAHRWSGRILAVAPTPETPVVPNPDDQRKERWESLRAGGLWVGGIALLSVWLGFLCLAYRQSPGLLALLSVKVMGILVSGLLVLESSGRGSSWMQKLCRVGSRSDCLSVLNSPASKLFGVVPMADLGVLYFLGGMVTMGLTAAAGVTALGCLRGMSLATLPYVCFSVFYQARVVRQWCPLCLAVQALFVIELLLWLLLQDTNFAMWNGAGVGLMAVGFGLPGFLWVLVRPWQAQASQAEEWRYRFLRLIRDPGVMAQLFEKESAVVIPALSGDLTLGVTNAPFSLTLVTSPVCQYCAEAHEVAQRLVSRYPHQVRVTFRILGSEESGDPGLLALHVLALGVEGRSKDALTLLHRWYQEKPATVSSLLIAFPLRDCDGSLEKARETLRKTQSWAQCVGVQGTPTIFVNDRRLPRSLRLQDLEHLLRSAPRKPVGVR